MIYGKFRFFRLRQLALRDEVFFYLSFSVHYIFSRFVTVLSIRIILVVFICLFPRLRNCLLNLIFVLILNLSNMVVVGKIDLK